MAGRGTDIILGGNINFKIQKTLYDILTVSKNYKLLKKAKILESSKSSFWELSKILSVILSLIDDPKFLELSDLDILRILRENDHFNSSYFIPMFYQILINELVLQ
jgi:DNA-binding transcriptional ArsR family regulator